MEAQTTAANQGFLKLNTKIYIQSPSATCRGINTNIWAKLNWEDVDLDCFLQKDDKDLSLRNIVMRVLPKPITTAELFKDDIFCSHQVHVTNCRGWSRHLMAESTSHTQPSAAPTFSFQEWSNTTEISQITVHLPKPNKGEAKEVAVEEVENEDVVLRREEPSCNDFPLKEPQEELVGLDSQQKTGPKAIQKNLDDFENLELLPDETVEVEEKRKEKSIRRKVLNWLDDLIHDHYMKKIAKTYKREEEEGDEFYPTNFYIFYPMTRAQRERQKRKMWLSREKQRQSIKRHLDVYWEEKRQQKEALRKNEEERFERWLAEHDISIPDPPSEESKMRMSLWKKRFLRTKEFFFQ